MQQRGGLGQAELTRHWDQLADAEKQESFVRTFAYTSGTAYGLLLDLSSADWRRRLRVTDDLATLVMNTLSIEPASDEA